MYYRGCSNLVRSWHPILQLTCWIFDLVEHALVWFKGLFHRYGLSLIERRPENVSVVIRALFGRGSGRTPGLVKELESYSEPAAEPVVWLFPKVLRWCHGLVSLWESRDYFSTPDTKPIGQIYCLCLLLHLRGNGSENKWLLDYRLECSSSLQRGTRKRRY